MDGIEAAGEMHRRRDVPIVFLTAYSDAETIERAKETAPYGYLLKPFDSQELFVTIEIALHKHKIDREKDNLMRELNAALEKVKLLSGLLPICFSCKKIRDDAGYWRQIERYIEDHSEAIFSHGLCPDCAQKLYPEHFSKKPAA